MSVQFVPSVWKAEGENVNKSADEFYRGAQQVIISEKVTTRTDSPIEKAAVDGDALCHDPWHQLISAASSGLTALGSKMVGTGEDYAATEEAAEQVAERFWQS